MSTLEITDEKIRKQILDVISDVSEASTIKDNVAQKVGEFLYYHTQIELCLDRLIGSLLPELEMDVLKIDSYSKKLSLIKSLTPNAGELSLFKLLEKLNKVRNIFAHENPNKINFDRINLPLINLFKSSFESSEEVYKKLERIGESGDIGVPVKVILMTKIHLDLLVTMESLGKKEDLTLQSFEALRMFSSLFVRRRFSILIYQFQTKTLSGDAPERFRQELAFKECIKEIKSIVLRLFQ